MISSSAGSSAATAATTPGSQAPPPATMAVLDAVEAARLAVLKCHSEHTRLQSLHQAAQAESLAARRVLEATRAELEQVRAERDQWREKCGHREAGIGRLEQQLAQQHQRNHRLNDEVLELYRDLRAADLPTLILRVGMNLTGAENALLVDGSGERTLAAIGLDDLPDVVSQALYRFTREALRQDAPVVRNDAQQLPDGMALVNLAALPLALRGVPQGAILVANKRTGPFTEADTELLLSIGRHAGIALKNRRLHGALRESYISTIAVLADAIEAKDPYTRGHCEGVSEVATRVAERLEIEGDQLEEMRYAALLHDVGKIAIPDGILLKPGRLLPEEFQVIQRHSSIGSDLVSRVPSLLPIAPVILHHHERIDGSGYPDGIGGDDILLSSRIIGAVDAFDAMTTPRPSRDPVSASDAVTELRRCAGSHFDTDGVSVVAEVLAERGQL